ncbi:MAG: serine hydrolase [Deltaproteobacteria bacterium]|nr:serine hydrolase [Deltaproteobacteria bacterium]
MASKPAVAATLIAALLIGCANTDRGVGREAFEPASSVEETFRWHRAHPENTAWWDVVGEQQAWYFKNIQQVYPSVTVYRAGPVRELGYRLMDEIANHPVKTPSGTARFADFLNGEDSTTMGLVILHEGEIAFEAYPRMEPYQKPIYWSVAKVLVSTLVAILEDRGLVDVANPIELYIPELKDSELAGISVIDILDMASGIDCTDNYADFDACYFRYETALGDGFRTDSSPDNPYDMLIDFDYGYWAKPGTRFDYSGVNTFLLGWMVEKITGMPFQDAFTREVWRHIGAEADATFFAGRYGVPLTHGGFTSSLRDLARFGLLFTPSYGGVSDRRIVSDRYLDRILYGGRPELLANSRFGPPPPSDVKHNVYQWDLVFDNGDFYKGGWSGQGLLINAERDYVAVYAGYFKDAEHSEIDLLPILREVLEDVFGNP